MKKALEGLKSPDVEIRRSSASRICYSADNSPALIRAHFALLVESLSDDDSEVREYIFSTFGSIGRLNHPAARKLLPLLQQRINDKDLQRSTSAIRILRNIGAEAVPVLIGAFQNPTDLTPTLLIAETLGQIGQASRSAILPIEKSLAASDGMSKVQRFRLARALVGIDNSNTCALRELLELSRDSDDKLSLKAIYLLSKCRSGNESVLPAVRVIVEKNADYVRYCDAMFAMWQLGPKAKDAKKLVHSHLLQYSKLPDDFDKKVLCAAVLLNIDPHNDLSIAVLRQQHENLLTHLRAAEEDWRIFVIEVLRSAGLGIPEKELRDIAQFDISERVRAAARKALGRR